MDEYPVLTTDDADVLNQTIADRLKSELVSIITVTCCGPHILIGIRKADFEEQLGNILQQLYRIIEQNFPVRSRHLLLIIGDTEGHYKNVFKIWKPG